MDHKIEAYCDNPYLDSYGAQKMVDKMTERYGKRYTDYREKWSFAESLEELDFPVNLELDLIDACTLSCPQCLRSPDILPAWKDYLGKGSKLAYEAIVKILDEGQKHGLPSINIGGSGECMLHPDFLRICKSIMAHDIIELRVISNGTRLTPEISSGLIEQQVHFVSISIDAMTPETYGLIRGKAEMYQRVFDNINQFLLLREKSSSIFPLLRVSFVRQNGNLHEVNQFIDYWSSRADLVDIQTFADYRQKDNFSLDFSCNQPWKRLAVYADGHVVPCCGFPGIKFDFGSIYEQSLKSIWNGEKMKALRKAHIDKDFPDPCIQCMGALASFPK